MKKDELYIAARLKDCIIIRGQNHFPQDIEQSVERSHYALRSGATAAISVDAAGEQQLVVLAELRRMRTDHASVTEAIRRAVAEDHGLQLHAAVLLPVGSLIKTSSGKLQRQVYKRAYINGSLPTLYCSVVTAPGDVPGERRAPGERGLAVQDPLERRQSIEKYLIDEIAAMLGIDGSQLDPTLPVTSFGLDSLKAAAISHRVEVELKVVYPPHHFLDHKSLRQAAYTIADQFDAAQSGAEPEGAVATPASSGRLSHGQRGLWIEQELSADAGLSIAREIRIRS